MHGSRKGNAANTDNAVEAVFRPDLQLQVNPDGWPVIPDTNWEDLTKSELELISRDFLSKHYSQFCSYQLPV